MGASLTAVQQIEFDALVKAQYRSRGFRLRDAVRMRQNVIGASVDFRKVDQVVAVATGYSQAVVAQDPGYTKANAVMQKYTAPIVTDTVQELTVNFDAKMENAMLVSDAMGRRSDQITIDALAADPGDTVADGGTNMSYAKYRDIIEFFEDNSVPLGDRWVAMTGNNLRALMADDQFVSTFYTKNDILDKGMVREYLGMNLVIIPANMVEGGLPKAGNIRSVLAWHRMSTGMGIGHNFRTEINYLPRETSWLVNGIFSAGAVVIDNTGVLEVECDESVNP